MVICYHARQAGWHPEGILQRVLVALVLPKMLEIITHKDFQGCRSSEKAPHMLLQPQSVLFMPGPRLALAVQADARNQGHLQGKNLWTKWIRN